VIAWFENHLFPCAFKTIFGIDCPICGFQRSFLFLIQGKIGNSFCMYPPLIPCLAFFMLIALYLIKKEWIKPRTLRGCFYTLVGIIFVSYFVKMIMLSGVS
jgi:hypothetical protein